MPQKKVTKSTTVLYKSVATLLQQSRNSIVQSVNTTIVSTYYQIGKLIVEHQQSGSQKADYGKFIITSLSEKLSTHFGKGFSVDNLENMRKLYLNFSISETVSRKSLPQKNINNNLPFFKLSWSHYVFLMRIENEAERKFYEIEAYNEKWSLRELKRQYNTSLYERLALSRNKKQVKDATENKTIGIVLCKNKKESIVKYTLPKNNKQIFTSKYKTYLPAKEDLQLLMEPEVEYISTKQKKLHNAE